VMHEARTSLACYEMRLDNTNRASCRSGTDCSGNNMSAAACTQTRALVHVK